MTSVSSLPDEAVERVSNAIEEMSYCTRCGVGRACRCRSLARAAITAYLAWLAEKYPAASDFDASSVEALKRLDPTSSQIFHASVNEYDDPETGCRVIEIGGAVIEGEP